MIKNKRGDIPITILVFGIVAICLLTLLSFYISENHSVNKFIDAGIIEKAAVQAEKIQVYKNLGLGNEEINKYLGIQQEANTGKNYIEFREGSVKVRYYLP